METEMETEMIVATRTANISVCNPQRPPHRTQSPFIFFLEELESRRSQY